MSLALTPTLREVQVLVLVLSSILEVLGLNFVIGESVMVPHIPVGVDLGCVSSCDGQLLVQNCVMPQEVGHDQFPVSGCDIREGGSAVAAGLVGAVSPLTLDDLQLHLHDPCRDQQA